MNIAIYARVSTEEQAKKGYSLDHQVSECKKQAYKDNQNNDIIFNEYIDDGFSGEFIERPLLTKLRDDARSIFFDKIYCYDPDRLSRTLMHQLILDEELNKLSTLIFVNGEYEKTPEGKLFYQLRGAVAEFEKAKINERMSNGRKTKAKKGMVIKDNHTYGYNFDKEKNQLVINEEEAKIVKFIFDSFTAKTGKFEGVNTIAKNLTQSGVPTKKGNKVWHRQVVRQILMNSTYTGKFIQNKWNTEGLLANKFKKDNLVRASLRNEEEWIIVSCPIIIDKAQFDYAQQLLETSRRRYAGLSKQEYLLSGLVRCNICGNTMTGRNWKTWDKKIPSYTDVKNTAGAKNKGCGFHISCAKLDKYVWDKIIEWLKDFKNHVEEENETFVSYEEEEKVKLTKLLEGKESSRKQLIKSISQGLMTGLSQEEINEILLESQKDLQEIKDKLIQIEKQIEINSFKVGKKNLLEESLEYYFKTNPEELSFQDKKSLIRYIVREIRVDKENIMIYGL